MELQKGDYVLCSDMTQEQHDRIAEVFKKHAGARGEAGDYFTPHIAGWAFGLCPKTWAPYYITEGYFEKMGGRRVKPEDVLGLLSESTESYIRTVSVDVPGYEPLREVLDDAYDQAARGKGKERHALDDAPFDAQPMQQLIGLYGEGFALGQAAKKLQEATRMDAEAAERELLGAIVYIAGALVHRRNAEE